LVLIRDDPVGSGVEHLNGLGGTSGSRGQTHLAFGHGAVEAMGAGSAVEVGDEVAGASMIASSLVEFAGLAHMRQTRPSNGRQ
jgi:hypothetical protein